MQNSSSNITLKLIEQGKENKKRKALNNTGFIDLAVNWDQLDQQVKELEAQLATMGFEQSQINDAREASLSHNFKSFVDTYVACIEAEEPGEFSVLAIDTLKKFTARGANINPEILGKLKNTPIYAEAYSLANPIENTSTQTTSENNNNVTVNNTNNSNNTDNEAALFSSEAFQHFLASCETAQNDLDDIFSYENLKVIRFYFDPSSPYYVAETESCFEFKPTDMLMNVKTNGWKVHLSIDDTDEDRKNLAKAWRIVKNILLNNKVSCFKIITPEAKAEGMQVGKQITIYPDHDAKANLDWDLILSKIEYALKAHNIRPSEFSPVDRRLAQSIYMSYRNDEGKSGESLRPMTIFLKNEKKKHKKLDSSNILLHNPSGYTDPFENRAILFPSEFLNRIQQQALVKNIL